jgi:hypothetical protein
MGSTMRPAMGEHVLDDAARLIAWAVRRTLEFDDPSDFEEGPAWLAARLAPLALGADVLRLAVRDAVRDLEDTDDYAAALALAAEFAATTQALLRRTAAA